MEEAGADQLLHLPLKWKAQIELQSHHESQASPDHEEQTLFSIAKNGTEEEEKLVGISKSDIKKVVAEFVKKHGSSNSNIIEVSPYPEIPDLPNSYHTFMLHHGGIPNDERESAIAAAKRYHAKYQANLLGYQCNQNLHFEKDFGSYLNILTNNIGDTFTEGLYSINSKFMERAVLDYYAELWRAQYPHAHDNPESYWGLCLNMGSTEGNLYGLWNARDYLGGKKILIDNSTKIVKNKEGISTQMVMPRLVYHAAPKPKNSPNAYTPIAFFSEDTHYSLSKAMTMLDIRTFYAEGMENFSGMCPLDGSHGEWPAEVPSHETGAMDLDALADLVEFYASRGHPIMVCFNYGTALKGAYDDVANACNKLRPILEKYGLLERQVQYDEEDESKVDVRTGYWFHVDGALGAAYMPYIEMAFHGGLVEKEGPTFDFRLPMVQSIAMSGHKWIGAPIPCGVYMTRTKYQMLPPTTPEIIRTPDTTFAGSRNGLSPMLLWDYIARTSYEDQVYKAVRLEKLAVYAEKQLLHLQEEVLKEDLYVERTPLSLTVRFKQVSEEIRLKYTLSNEELDGRYYSHIFVMEHVTPKLIDSLIHDLSKKGAFAFSDVGTLRPFAPVEDTLALAPTTHRLSLIPSQGRGYRG